MKISLKLEPLTLILHYFKKQQEPQKNPKQPVYDNAQNKSMYEIS